MIVSEQFKTNLDWHPQFIDLSRIEYALSKKIGKPMRIILQHKHETSTEQYLHLSLEIEEKSLYVSTQLVSNLFDKQLVPGWGSNFEGSKLQKLLFDDYYATIQMAETPQYFKEAEAAYELKANLKEVFDLETYLSEAFDEYADQFNIQASAKKRKLEELIIRVTGALKQATYRPLAETSFLVMDLKEGTRINFNFLATRRDYQRLGLQSLLGLIILTKYKPVHIAYLSVYGDGAKFSENSGLMIESKIYRNNEEGLPNRDLVNEFEKNPARYVEEIIKPKNPF